ncbi:mediator complex subunit [Agyrium rufum]|nr:mediator complex subunit [Agyrium rufum]
MATTIQTLGGQSNSSDGATYLETLLQQTSSTTLNPRVLEKIEKLITGGFITVPDVLQIAMRLYGRTMHDAKAIREPVRQRRDYMETSLLRLATRHLSKLNRRYMMPILRPFVQWLSFYCTSYPNSTELSASPVLSPLQDVGIAISQFSITYVNRLTAMGVMDAKGQVHRKTIQKFFPPFISAVSHIEMGLAQSLLMTQKHNNLAEDWKSGAAFDSSDIATLRYQESIVDGTQVHTRAALFIYLNAVLCSRPLGDDARLFDYLDARSNGDVASLITDLITAAFDVLANAINRNETPQNINIIRSFLSNKLPTLLLPYSALLFEPVTTEVCITQALNRMDSSAYVSYTQMVDLLGSSGMLADARSEFLFACALHRLIPEESIEGILGDVPMQSMPESGKYSKEALRQQCLENPSRAETLVSELENMEGNAPEIAGALIKLIHECLEISDMALEPASYLADFFRRGSHAYDPQSLSDIEQSRLGGWIENLYGSEGISDEFMSTCSPKSFHLIAATLYEQSFLACSSGRLGVETLKEGFEYLLKPILLSSLFTGLAWFSSHMLSATSAKASINLDVLFTALTSLINPPSISQESSLLHATILSTTSPTLETALIHMQRIYPRRPDIEPLLKTIRSVSKRQRTLHVTHEEVEAWSSFSGGGLTSAVRNTVSSLINWCSTTDGSSVAPNYTHHQLLLATRLLGARTVLASLIDELIKQEEQNKATLKGAVPTGPTSTDIALDVITTLIIAPTITDTSSTVVTNNHADDSSGGRRFSLRYSLSILNTEAYLLSKKFPQRSAIIVRLARHVQVASQRSANRANGLDTALGEGYSHDQVQSQGNLGDALSNVDDAMMMDITAQVNANSGAGGMDMDEEALLNGLSAGNGMDARGVSLEDLISGGDQDDMSFIDNMDF